MYKVEDHCNNRDTEEDVDTAKYKFGIPFFLNGIK